MTAAEALAVQLIDVPAFVDARGAVGVAQEGDAVPFPIRRLFYLFDLAPGASRGHHAHRVQHQFVVMMTGRCQIIADDGVARQSFVLHSPRQGLVVPPMTWLELSGFSDNAVCAVLASDAYDEADYVRDYDMFRRLAEAGERPL